MLLLDHIDTILTIGSILVAWGITYQRLNHIEKEQERDREKFVKVFEQINDIDKRVVRIEAKIINGKDK